MSAAEPGAPLRILAVGLLYPPHYVGGYELLCQGAMRAAGDRGHSVRVLVSDYRSPQAVQQTGPPRAEPQVHRELRSYLDASARRAADLGPGATIALERHNAAVLERHLREFTPHVVSWWAMGGMSLSLIERVRREGIPSVLAIEDHWLYYGPMTDRWTNAMRRYRLAPLAPVIERALGVPATGELERAGRYLFNSSFMADAAAAAGFRAQDWGVVSPGVHERFRSAPAPEWGGRLLYVGRLDAGKAVDVIVAAMALLGNETTLTVIGAGEDDYAEQLRAQARELGVERRVSFAGPRGAEELPAEYERADALIFPVRWEEPWGLVPLEAMAVGRPVIATSMGGAATYLRDGENAVIIPVEDARALADAVRGLAASPELRESLVQGGLRTAALHTAARHDELIVDELERAAGR